MPEPALGRRYFAAGKAIVPLNETQEEAKKIVEELIQDGNYKFESVPCLCGASFENDLVLATVDRYGLEHRTVICQNCGLVRTNPRLTQASYNHFYENLYRQLYSGWHHLDEAGFRKQFEHYLPRGERIVEFLQSNKIDVAGKTVLDIGSGGGWTFPAFAQRGAKTIGFDYGEYIEFGKKLYNLDLRYGGIEEAANQGMKADIIILSHVVEHFTDPVGELKHLRNLLSSGGMVYIEVPGILNLHVHRSDCDFMKLLVLPHVYYFSARTLCYLVNMSGYEVMVVDEFIQMLCNSSHKTFATTEINLDHSKKIIEYLKDCEKKRRFRALAQRLRFVSTIPKRAIVISLKAVGLYPFVRKLYRKVRA